MKGNGIRKLISIGVVLTATLIAHADARADWQADPDDKRQVKASRMVERFKERIPRTRDYFDDAYGYAILPSVTRVGFGFSGSYGRGLVVEGDELIGTTGFWQFSSGIQAGAKYFSMLVFFRDREALEYFKLRRTQFVGQAGLAFATVGADGTPAYNEGVAIVTMTRFGLMGEFAAAGSKYTYKPLENQ